MRTNWTMKLSQQMVMSNPKLRKNENNTAACVSFKKKISSITTKQTLKNIIYLKLSLVCIYMELFPRVQI